MKHEKKNIIVAVDYDETFSTSPESMHKSLSALKKAGYHIVGVTWRNRYQLVEDELYTDVCEAILYCAGNAKRKELFVHYPAFKYHVIWLDDKPEAVLESYEDLYGGKLEGNGQPDFYTPLLYSLE